jgi:phenylacetate-CoA ligase
VREHFEELKAKNFQSLKPLFRTTGGTTGKPLTYFSDEDEHSVFWADLWRAWTWAGYELGDRRASIGGSRPSSSGFSYHSYIRSRIMERNLSLSSFDVTPEAMGDHVEKLRKFKPKVIRGYPSSLFLFARYINENTVSKLGIKSVISISEQLYEHQRKTIEEAFECPVFDNYGCPDGGVLACECEEHEYHLNSENAIVEIIKDGEVVGPGEEGEMVSTNLTRFAMPFIRYRTGDVGKRGDNESICGRGLRMLASISGRTSDYIILSDGNLLSGVSIAALFNSISSKIHIQQYQVVQESRDKIDIFIVKAKGYSETDTELLENALRDNLGKGMGMELKFVNNVPLTVHGKTISVISKLPLEFK